MVERWGRGYTSFTDVIQCRCGEIRQLGNSGIQRYRRRFLVATVNGSYKVFKGEVY